MNRTIKELSILWEQYKKYKEVLTNPYPPMGVVFSFEDFWLWLMEKR